MSMMASALSRSIVRRALAALVVLPLVSAPAFATTIERVVSPGGIEAWLVHEPAVPMIAIDFAFVGGTAQDAPGKGGTATVIGMVPVGQRLEIDATQLIAGKRLQGSNMGSNRFRFDMPQYVEWYLAGKLKLDELVSATMPLAKINDAFTALKSGEVARQLILFD